MMDLLKCTFLIPVRFDFQERINNLNYVLNYLNGNFNTNIFLYEESITPVFHIFKEKVKQYKYFYSKNEFFHRTKIINYMIKDCDSEIVINYDSDVVLDINSYTLSYNSIINKEYDMIFPYDKFWNIDKIQTKKIINNQLNLNNLNLSICKKRRINSVGGCIFFNRESYIKGGMENENFKAWGAEDDERYQRFFKLGFKINRLKDLNLYHLDHPRGINSLIHSSYYRENIKELNKISNMKKEELEEYIKNKKI